VNLSPKPAAKRVGTWIAGMRSDAGGPGYRTRQPLAMAAACAVAIAVPSLAHADNPFVVLETSAGDITVELFPDKAPATVANFLSWVDSNGYDGTIFHRVIAGFMIQGGGYTADLTALDEAEPVINEADNGLANDRGTIAMAREDVIDSASRQFFINVDDNRHLDHTAGSCTRQDEADFLAAAERGLRKPVTCDTFGYAVFGRVVDGMTVVDTIELAETTFTEAFDDLPVEPVIIREVRRVKPPAAHDAPGR